MTRRIRLVKVMVQPHFVYDDGTELTEIPPEVHEISPADWPTYSSERFPKEVADWQQREAEAVAESNGIDPARAKRKRAAARSSSRRPAKR